MFKILAGDYGNPPMNASITFGTVVIGVSEEIEKTLKGFNNRDSVFGQVTDDLRKREDVTKIEILDEDSYQKEGVIQFINTVGGAAAYGPAGALLGNVGKNKKDFLFFVETRVGNSFIAKADEKTFRKIKSKFGPTDEQIAADSFRQMKASEGTKDSANNQNPKVDLVKELEKLGALKEKGFLTDEEFSAAKAKLLS